MTSSWDLIKSAKKTLLYVKQLLVARLTRGLTRNLCSFAVCTDVEGLHSGKNSGKKVSLFPEVVFELLCVVCS